MFASCMYGCTLFMQLFFIDETGEDCFTSKADVWSALLTLIYVLLGKSERNEPLEKVMDYVAM